MVSVYSGVQVRHLPNVFGKIHRMSEMKFRMSEMKLVAKEKHSPLQLMHEISRKFTSIHYVLSLLNHLDLIA